MAKGLTASKAKKILEDGTVRGKALTEKQKKFFGAVAGGATPLKKLNGGWLDKFAMGGSLPGASGMMYARTSGTSPEEPKKAQEGTIQLDEVVVTAPGRKKDTAFRDSDKDGNVVSRFLNVGRGKKREELFKDMPEYLQINDDGDYVLSIDQQKELKNLGITDLDSYNDYFGTNYSRDNALNEFNYLNYYKPQYDDMISSIHGATNQAAENIMTAASFIPAVRGAGLLSKIPQAYRSVAGPIGQAYRYTANTPVGKAASKYIGKPFSKAMNYKPLGGPLSIGNYADAAALGYSSYNIGPDVKELYNNPSWSAAGNVGLDALGFTPLLNKKFTKPLMTIGKYYTNPLGSAFKIGMKNPKIPTFLTRGQNPPNKLLTNPKIDADNFMQSWTNPNNPSFVGKFDAQILKPFPNASMSENYLRVKTRELNVLQQQLDDFVEATGTNVLPKAKSLQKSIDALTSEINLFYRPLRGNLARTNMKAIQAGEFNTVYSTTGYSPGSGGTYFVPSASQPMNTWKYMYPNQPNKIGVGNNSVVKINEVPVGATDAVKNKAKTREMLTGIHETLGHASNAGGTALTKQTNDLIKSALKKNPKIKEGSADWVKDFFKDPNATFKDWADYLEDPTEVVARVQEIRRQYIPKEFWGTDKQYEITDKLVDRIFRDGLSGKAKLPADFFRVVDKKGLKKLMKGIYATIPLAAGANEILETETTKFKDGGRCWPGYKAVAGKTPFSKGSCQKAQEGTIVDIARRYADNKTDGLRPAVGAVDKLKAIFNGEDGCVKDNTCVQVVKEIVNEASIGKENAPYIPADIFNNREFRKNYKDYGFLEVRPEDGGERFREDELRPGDILQYYYNKDSEGVKEGDGFIGFPYHLGVYDELDQYISDGDVDHPTERQNMYIDADGNKKDPFYVYRPKEKRNGGWLDKFQKGGVIQDRKKKGDSALKNWYYNQEDVLGSYTMGDKVDDSWLANWISHPETKKRIANLNTPYISSFDTEETKNKILEKANINAQEEIDEAINDLRETPVYAKSVGNYKDLNYNNKIQGFNLSSLDLFNLSKNALAHFLPDDNAIYDPTGDKAVTTHELSHATRDYSRSREIDMNKAIDYKYRRPDEILFRETISRYQDFDKEELDSYKNNHPAYLKHHQDYIDYLNDDGYYQRIMEIRRNLNVNPGEEITKEKLEKVKKTGGYRDLDLKYTEDQILKILNTVADNSDISSKNPYAKSGKVINDDRGQWAYPGKITKINSNNITMKGVNYPVLGISDTGDKKMMQPGKDYKFDGNSVTEYPMAKDGKSLVALDQLTNFTNYNTPQPGGWLDKY